MDRRPALPLTLCAFLLLPAAAGAAEAPPAPAVATPAPGPAKGADVPLSMQSLKLKFSGLIFASWGYDLAGPNPEPEGSNDDTEGANRFDLSRAYLNFEPQLGEKISLRITPDITRVSDKGSNVDGSLAFRLKYAYVQFNDVLPGVSLKAGEQHTAWIDFEDSVWKHRVLGPAGLETFTGMSSADLGLGVIGKHGGGLFEYQLVLSNGEGYSRPESSVTGAAKYKDAAARLTVAPLASLKSDWTKGLKLSVFHQYGITRSFGEEHEPALRLRTLGMLTWETKWFALGAGGGPTTDGEEFEDAAGVVGVKNRSGLLLESFAVVQLPYDLRLLARFDRYDPNVDLSPVDDPGEDGTSGVRSRTIAGVGYQLNDLLAVIADYQAYGYEEPANTKRTDPGSTFFLHLEAKY